MTTQYIISIPRDAENTVLACCELFGQHFKSYDKLEKAVKSYGIEFKGSHHVDTFMDDLNNKKIDLDSNKYIPVTVKEDNEYRR